MSNPHDTQENRERFEKYVSNGRDEEIYWTLEGHPIGYIAWWELWLDGFAAGKGDA